MTYDASRESEQLRYLAQIDIANFVLRYQSNPPGAGRRTLFLFPGGMASRLLRARKAYKNNGPAIQTFYFDEIWLNTITFLGAALSLEMHPDGGGYRDSYDKIIIPNGVVDWFGLNPYDRFIRWCELNDLDWFVFSWDWRRRPEDSVSLFRRFLPIFRASVQGQTGHDPLADYVMVGHSFGGIIIDLILQQNIPLPGNMTRAVTVSTPFYGYDGQIQRWFKGEPYLNHLGTRNVVEAITSMPGCYVLPYLDTQTFATHGAALAADPNYPLAAYPCKDVTTRADVDPFNPGANRYPGNTGFSTAELTHGRQTYRNIAAGPAAQFRNRFHNIRGVQSRPANSTVGSVSWNLLRGVFNPGQSPVRNGPAVPGDDTQPAWSARLATLPANQCHTIVGDIDHMFMMEYDETHAQLAQVL
jgi:hypothetical protein